MSISEKLTTIAENQEKVYDAGYEKANRDFWDYVTQKGKRKVYEQAFSYWDCEYIHPPYKIIPDKTSRILSMFNANPSLKKVEKEYFDLSEAKYDWSNYIGYRMFYNCPNLEIIEDINILAGKYDNTFAYCPNLKTIEILRVEERSTFYATFFQCYNLQDLTIDGVIGQNGFNVQWSTNLTPVSLRSIIDALKDYSEDTSGTQWIVTIGATNYDKLTTEEIEKAERKGWTLQ